MPLLNVENHETRQRSVQNPYSKTKGNVYFLFTISRDENPYLAPGTRDLFGANIWAVGTKEKKVFYKIRTSK
jgi:hypothetical protein